MAEIRKNVSAMAFIDPIKLRKALDSITVPGTNEWCVACGASKGASPLDRMDWIKESSQLLDPSKIVELAKNMRELGEKAWCVACGAESSVSKLEQISNPAIVSDSTIDELATRIIGAIEFK